MFFKEYFDILDANGYTITPLNGKKPLLTGWQHLENNPELKNSYPNNNVGIVLKNEIAIDVDVLDEECSEAISKSITETFGDNLPTRFGKRPKFLVLLGKNEEIRKYKVHLISPNGDDDKHAIEFLANGQQIAALGDHPGTKKPYSYLDDAYTPLTIPSNELVMVTEHQIREWLLNIHKILPDGWKVEKIDGLPKEKNTPKKISALAPSIAPSVNTQNFKQYDYSSLEKLLDYLDPDENYDEWIKSGMAVHNFSNGELSGFEIWDNYSKKGSKYVPDDCWKHWNSFDKDANGKNPVTIGFIIKEVCNNLTNIIKNCNDADKLMTDIADAIKNVPLWGEHKKKLMRELSKQYEVLTGNKLSKNQKKSITGEGSAGNDNFELTDDALIVHTYKNDEPISIVVSGPITVKAITHDSSGNSYGRLLTFKNVSGKSIDMYVPMKVIADKRGDFILTLVDKGLHINLDHSNYLIRYINSQQPGDTFEITHRTGWHNNSFVMPHKTIGDQNIFYQSNGFNSSSPCSESGSLEEWKNKISAYCIDNPLLMFAVSLAFSGPLLDKVKISNGAGCHFFGPSSKGKSTILKVACSVYGIPKNYAQSWRVTSNGLEATAESFNHLMLGLDEIKEIDPKQIGETIYMLANGSGKVRANKDGDAKNVKKWLISILSTGEVSANNHAASSGKTTNAGQNIRLLDIPIFGEYGCFDNLHDQESGFDFATYLDIESKKYYGIAGVTWIEKIISTDQDFESSLADVIKVLIEKSNNANLGELSSQDERVLKFFAVVALAGELATSYDITEWKDGDSTQAAFACFKQWKMNNGFASGDIEQTQVCQLVQNYVDFHGNSRFQWLNTADSQQHNEKIYNQAGYKKMDTNQTVYLFNDSAFKEALSGHELNSSINILKAKNWLITCKDGRPKKQIRIGNEQKRLYHIRITDIDE
jgi:putative DNA primase/helicase